MVVQLVFLQLILLLWPSAVEPYLAKPGCNERCGNVTIPYPFGMGNNCFMGQWFEIDCKRTDNSSSRPSLKKLDLEVLEILQPTTSPGNPGLIRVNTPVFSSNCSRSNVSSPRTAVNFTGSPFVFSQTENSFTAAGCNSSALMAHIEPVLSGCASPCGGGCCQATIPPNLQVFNVTFEGKAEECKYAFLVSKNWSRPDSSCVAAVQDLEYVPTLLEIRRGERVEGPDPYLYARFRIRIGAVIVLSCGLGLPISIFILWWLRKVIRKRNKIKRKKIFFTRNGGLLLEQQVTASQGNVETTKVFTSKELEIATDRFNKNRILGQGGQGTVYKGMLSDGRIVAVKKSKIENEGTLIEQFINEVVILSQINHRNIVKLLGCCLETEVPLLVYEFVPNGTLSQYLHDQVEDFIVSWEMRLQIATEVAGALSYLHSAASIPIYHRDIKSSNILLDDKYKAKVADFGTSRSVPIEQTHLTTIVQGTFGYLDPEYFQSSQFSDKSDVYSFGVVLVELLTGQKAISSLRIQEGRGLATYFIITMEDNQLSDILDTQVANYAGKYEVIDFANLAKRCLDLNGRNRPTMAEVRTELERISKLHKSTNGNGEAHCEEVEFFSSQEVEPCYDSSTSTDSDSDSVSISVSAMDIHRAAASVDSQPVLPDPIW